MRAKLDTEWSGYRAGLARVLDRRTVSLERLFAFFEIANEGGPAKAARGSEIKKKEFQRKIRELNDHFGVDLIADGGAEWRLTRHGKNLFEIIKPFALAMVQFNDDCAHDFHVSIGAGDRIMQWFLIPRLKALQDDLLDHKFELFNLSSDEIHARIANSTLDFGIVRASEVRGVRGPCSHEVAFTLNYAIFVKATVAVKKDAQWVLQKAPLAVVSKYQSELREASNERLNVKLLCSTFPQAWRAVASGYAAILPVSAFQEQERSDIISLELPFEMRGLEREKSFSLIWGRSLKRRKDFSKVLEALKCHLCKPAPKPHETSGHEAREALQKEKVR